MHYRPPEKMTLEGLQEFIDQYAGTQVSQLFFCPNGMRVNYDTRAKDWESRGLVTTPKPTVTDYRQFPI